MPAVARKSDEIGVPRMEATGQLIMVFSFYRDAELRGARLLLNLHNHLRDGDSQAKLTRHLADETRHAMLWTHRIAELGAAPAVIADGYQRRLGARIGVPKDTLELLALTLVAEGRAIDRYQSHAAMGGVDRATLEVLKAVSADEPWHLSWIERKMNELADERGERERAGQVLARYREIEKDVYASFLAEEAALATG
ncbi:MAG TPA: ferritin-like domain-containing protein [Candidatus Binataceae bacterium]|nr:ferritin-like domain-containing protein [Candidatus Binataceae bacterium]